MNDAATLAGMIADEFQATYTGTDRGAYLGALRSWITDLGGVVEEGPNGPVVRIESRTIAVLFGPLSGHR